MLSPDPESLTALLFAGIAWAFIRADAETATSRALAVALTAGGVATALNAVALDALAWGRVGPAARLAVVAEGVGFWATFEWVLRVRRTIPAGELRTTAGDVALRVAEALVLVYVVNGLLDPELRLRGFFGGLEGATLFAPPVVARFVAPLGIALLLWMLAVVLCLNRRPEPAERVRLVAFLVAVPVIAAGIVLPVAFAGFATVLGLSILLAGALRHAQLRGSQAQFMSRFLSPQVAAMVSRGGLRAAMREERREISVVCVDLRGFTPFAGASDSQTVIALLRDYYDAVGAAVTEFEGTIKDYAGDGVLVLLGAPGELPDHAERAVALARRIHTNVQPVVDAHAGTAQRLGIGAGVASGPVTVGVIGGAGPLEYAAVGQAVNLASRLCEVAAPGETLLAADTVRLLGQSAAAWPLEARSPLALKGFAEAVAHHAMAAV